MDSCSVCAAAPASGTTEIQLDHVRVFSLMRRNADIESEVRGVKHPNALAIEMLSSLKLQQAAIQDMLSTSQIQLSELAAKMEKVPKETNCTTVIRLDGAGQDVSGQDDLHGIADNQPVVLVMQTCSHDAPYGEHFRVQETLRFVRTDGGVELQRWVEVIWVKSLPWSMTPLKKIIEVKTVTGAEEADKAIVQFIQEAIETAAE
ncbi:CACNA1H [Symbiodinium pilosum]|uniref:CACNA1H protein n=1 Tax=Symbiodinium pilosum TaxID=2952 RepID=A0A812XTT8_SYMPI|nr:CACNA1H [Symbiodinium pilosum]